VTRTVKELREELAKFRDDAVCYAYEGEVTGIVISPPGSWGGPGVIYCGESADVEPPTENHPSVTSREVLVRASDYDALAVENAALKDECAALVNGDEYQAMQRTLGEVNARLAEALERAAAAESKEVCTVAHSDEVMEFCPYCKIERLTARLAEAERELSAIYAACRTNPDLADYIYDVFGMAAWIIKPEIGDDAHG